MLVQGPGNATCRGDAGSLDSLDDLHGVAGEGLRVHPPWPDCGTGQPQAKLAGEHRGTGRGVEGSWAPQTDDHLWHPVKGECPN